MAVVARGISAIPSSAVQVAVKMVNLRHKRFQPTFIGRLHLVTDLHEKLLRWPADINLTIASGIIQECNLSVAG
jgi:hypothetical protein